MSDTDGPTKSLTKVLQLLLENRFPDKIRFFLLQSREEESSASVAIHLKNALKLMNAMITIIPNDSQAEVTMTMHFLGPLIEDLQEHMKFGLQEYQSQVNANLESFKQKQNNRVKERTRRMNPDLDLHFQPPPDEFRMIPVFPRMIDINGDAEVFLRTNLLNRAYENVDHYLDVQFRLLREDFIRPLRDGIAEFKHSKRLKRRYIDNVKVYEDVQVQFSQPGRLNGILHRIQFNVSKLRGVTWHNTKRLMHGNLLCLSSDEFKEEVIFATVMNSIPGDLANGILTVKFATEMEEGVIERQDDDEIGAARMLEPGKELKATSSFHAIDSKKLYTMVETGAYFEGYRHILSGLKETERIPLERYIVYYRGFVLAPRYLRSEIVGSSVKYEFSPITRRGVVREVLGGVWPTPEEMSLDPTQASALKLALTKELAIIQGPPGTGKTHVGLAIMKLLLENKTCWSHPTYRGRNKRGCPILVVCFTNHALDQFLGGIASFADGQKIVRVGGGIKSEELKRFSLREQSFQRRKVGGSTTIRQAVQELDGALNDIEEQWYNNIQKLEASLRCIPNVNELRQFILPDHYQPFEINMRRSTRGKMELKIQEQNHILLSWLGITNILTDSGGGDEGQLKIHPSQEQENRKHTDATQNEDFDLEEIERDAAPDRERRLLETDIPRKANTSNNESDIAKVVHKIGAISLSEINKSLAEDEDEERKLDGDDDAGHWEQQGHQKRKQKRQVKSVIRGTEAMKYHEEYQVSNIYDLSLHDRWRLYRTWVNRWRQHCTSGIDQEIDKYGKLARQLEEVRHQVDSEILQEADVVAVTTTGAAKYRDIIYKLDCKVVIVEEAAEVLESHIITAMPRSTNHLILIGDHRQLKPSPTVYELARRYNLDTSLFERLVKRIPHVTLSRQHRMRPSIADLIRPHIYRHLEDDESVLIREDITGLEKPMFFISHTEKEDDVIDGKSKKNQHEADFIVALCNYIVLQGYKPEQITILTMYTGQLFAFRKRSRGKVPDGVRVTAVDNFQGEENDIILLSLVRSNDEERIGFLAIENRICVALSRARSALYCIGNMEMLASKSKMWKTIVQHLHEKECIGSDLVLKCKHHPDRKTEVNCRKDFDQVPEGGCGHPCGARLDCGHVCPKPCHPYDHSQYRCVKPCEKTVPCGYNHPCKRKCWQKCEPCLELILKVIPKCGHEQKVLCQTSPDIVVCLKKISVELLCGHVDSIPCHKTEPLKLSMCKENCEEILECGHSCKGSCYDCFQGRLHVPCAEPCKRTLVCGHSCRAYCESCPPCTLRCETRCRHSHCEKTCGQPCVLCQEKCGWVCPHYKCSRLCCEPCDRPPCNKPCKKTLKKCGHSCIGLCGEPCPKLCRICDKEEVSEIFFGHEDDKHARFVELEDCGHIFTYQSLDQWMAQEEIGNAIKMKQCPKCKTTIWRSTRYGSIINSLLITLNKVKTKIWGDPSEVTIDIKNQFYSTRRICDAFGFNFEISHNASQKPQSKERIFLLQTKMKRLDDLRRLTQVQDIRLPGRYRLKDGLSDRLRDDIKRLHWWISLKRTQTTDPEERDFQQEMKRIKQAVQFCEAMNRFERLKISIYADRLTQKVTEEIEFIMDHPQHLLLENITPYDCAREEEVNSLVEKVKRIAPELFTALGVSKEEMAMIRKAMNFATKGHWYSCSKGHVYAIGECGGATETSVCPECNEKIGGSSHRLLESNRVATEIDGATKPAYDPENTYIPPEEP